MATGTAVYDLQTDYMGTISLEYPDREDPQQYLTTRPYTHPLILEQVGYYDIIDQRDDTDPSQVAISSTVAT